MSRLDEQIAATEQRLKALKARQVRTATKQRARDAKQKRQAVLRRKILVGAVVLDLLERGKLEASQLAEWLDGAVMEEEDRKLFAIYFEEDLGSGANRTASRSRSTAMFGGGSATTVSSSSRAPEDS